MSKMEKRLQALREGRDLPWDKIKAALISCGATITPGKGSHFIVSYQGLETLSIPVHNGRIKPRYVKDISQFLDDMEK